MERFSFARACCAGLLLMLAACSSGDTTSGDTLAAEENDPLARAEAVLAHLSRLPDDRADDALRKPAEVLAFIDVKPGMKIFEVEGGAGYYTELLSALTGPDGAIVMQNPESFDAFLGDAVAKRVNGRLLNVRISKSNFDSLNAGDASMDMVTWMLGPHDLYYAPNGAASLGNDVAAFAEIMRILKPGGAFIVLDHAASPGSPRSTGGTVHRIDPAIVLELARGAGFVLSGESDVLRNPDDNYAVTVFDPSVRRMTDQFLYKFKKPE